MILRICDAHRGGRRRNERRTSRLNAIRPVRRNLSLVLDRQDSPRHSKHVESTPSSKNRLPSRPITTTQRIVSEIRQVVSVALPPVSLLYSTKWILDRRSRQGRVKRRPRWRRRSCRVLLVEESKRRRSRRSGFLGSEWMAGLLHCRRLAFAVKLYHQSHVPVTDSVQPKSRKLVANFISFSSFHTPFSPFLRSSVCTPGSVRGHALLLVASFPRIHLRKSQYGSRSYSFSGFDHRRVPAGIGQEQDTGEAILRRVGLHLQNFSTGGIQWLLSRRDDPTSDSDIRTNWSVVIRISKRMESILTISLDSFVYDLFQRKAIASDSVVVVLTFPRFQTKKELQERKLWSEETLPGTALLGLAGGATSGMILSCGTASLEITKVSQQLAVLLSSVFTLLFFVRSLISISQCSQRCPLCLTINATSISRRQ